MLITACIFCTHYSLFIVSHVKKINSIRIGTITFDLILILINHQSICTNNIIKLKSLFVWLNVLISGTTGSNWKIIFVLDSTFIDKGYRLYFIIHHFTTNRSEASMANYTYKRFWDLLFLFINGIAFGFNDNIIISLCFLVENSNHGILFFAFFDNLELNIIHLHTW